jgi:hypothetical protein
MLCRTPEVTESARARGQPARGAAVISNIVRGVHGVAAARYVSPATAEPDSSQPNGRFSRRR